MTERDVASIADLRPDPENAAALDLLHKWQSEDPAYDREAWARLTGARVTERDAITFDAVIPSNMSALRIHGESGMRITLDVDETNRPRRSSWCCGESGC